MRIANYTKYIPLLLVIAFFLGGCDSAKQKLCINNGSYSFCESLEVYKILSCKPYRKNRCGSLEVHVLRGKEYAIEGGFIANKYFCGINLFDTASEGYTTHVDFSDANYAIIYFVDWRISNDTGMEFHINRKNLSAVLMEKYRGRQQGLYEQYSCSVDSYYKDEYFNRPLGGREGPVSNPSAGNKF